MTHILTPAILAATLLGTGAALASDDCRSPMSQWQSQDAAVQHMADLGIEMKRLKIDDGCYEIKGRDSDGNEIELKLEPATLALRKLKVECRAGSDPSRYLKEARAMTPIERKDPAD